MAQSHSQDDLYNSEAHARDSSRERTSGSTSASSRLEKQDSFLPISNANSGNNNENEEDTPLTEQYTTRTLSRRKSHASGHEGDEWAQIERLISRMFGHERKANSEEEKTRHVGVVWKNLTVKGLGLGAALQPTTGDIFLGIPRFIKGLLRPGKKGTGVGKSETRTILNDFTVSF